jgi:hypothetical protein
MDGVEAEELRRTHPKQLDQVVVLPMNVATNCDRCRDVLHILLTFQDLPLQPRRESVREREPRVETREKRPTDVTQHVTAQHTHDGRVQLTWLFRTMLALHPPG